MKIFVPLLAVFCFSLAGVGCKSTCCGSCGGDHGHSHGDKDKCCSTDGKCCKKKEEKKEE